MVKTFPFYFPFAQEERGVHLWLPDNYFNSNERYPVMYMFDGHNLFFDSSATYGKSWGLPAFLSGWWKEIIIVGLECSHTGNQRLVEYCPYNIKTKLFGDIDGTGEATFQWIINDVKPFIDSHFRTWAHREATGIAGSSMGGMMSLYGVIRHNDIFSKSAAISPAFFGSQKDILNYIHDMNINPDTRLWMSWGGREDRYGWMNRCCHSIEKELMPLGVTTMLYKQQGGRHNEACWEQQTPKWLPFLWE